MGMWRIGWMAMLLVCVAGKVKASAPLLYKEIIVREGANFLHFKHLQKRIWDKAQQGRMPLYARDLRTRVSPSVQADASEASLNAVPQACREPGTTLSLLLENRADGSLRLVAFAKQAYSDGSFGSLCYPTETFWLYWEDAASWLTQEEVKFMEEFLLREGKKR